MILSITGFLTCSDTQTYSFVSSDIMSLPLLKRLEAKLTDLWSWLDFPNQALTFLNKILIFSFLSASSPHFLKFFSPHLKRLRSY